MGMYVVASPAASGLAMDIDPTLTTPLTGSPYAAIYGRVVPANPGTGSRELGWLLQPVTANGPSTLSIIIQVYDESVAAGQTAVLVSSKAGALIGTDQYLATGTGHIAFDGTVALGTLCSIVNGQPQVAQTGQQPRLKFLGKVVQRSAATPANPVATSVSLASFQIL